MGCVVDSVARPARDGSDGCCYLTTAPLAAAGWRREPAAVGVKGSPRMTHTSDLIRALWMETKTCGFKLSLPNGILYEPDFKLPLDAFN